jgi:hypothetical protein
MARMTRGISRRACQSAQDKSNRNLDAASGRSTGALHPDLRGRPAYRHRLQGQVREGRLPGARRSTGGRRPSVGPRTRKPEMGEDPLDDDGVGDRGHRLHPSGGPESYRPWRSWAIRTCTRVM